MIIEQFKDIQIAYIRRTGQYGEGNKKLMEEFKNYLKIHDLFTENTTILAIALDDPSTTPENQQRYDIGIMMTDQQKHHDLPVRGIDDGAYAVFEIEHTPDAILDFWKNIERLTSQLAVDFTKPIIERYSSSKILMHLCEFCIPLK
ncbi:GyrI-like domain-containing protein [[Clostridium] spiroforme]|nr:GyrI-like domain-containing protein [Thomasclavelia spiroformis]